jgi:hypothetical protein
MSYEPKIYKVDGGNELVVDSGGKITLKAGSSLVNSGDFFTSVTFDSDYFTVSNDEVTLKSSVEALLDVIAGIPTTDPEADGEVWLSGGKLVVSVGA